MKKLTRDKKLLIAGAFGAMALALAALLALGLSRGDPVRFGAAKGTAAYGACVLMQTGDAGYTATLASSEAALRDALTSGRLDAALLPVDMALLLPPEEYAIEAVLGYSTLIALSSDAVAGAAALDGKTLALPKDAKDTPVHTMLLLLLEAARAQADISFVSMENMGTIPPADVLLVPLDALYDALQGNAALSPRFSLSAQWRAVIGSEPPAGACLVVRRDYLNRAGGDYDRFLKKLADSVSYADEKRKKAVAMIVAAGLADSEKQADAAVGYHPFVFLRDAAANAALASYDAVSH